MKTESLKRIDQRQQLLQQLEKNQQLITIIEKKIEEVTQIKINKLNIINIDQLDQQQGKIQVKIDHQQLSHKQQNDQEYVPENDVSSSQSVQKQRFYHLRERELKIITKEQFEKKNFNEAIQIIDDSQHSQPKIQKHENVKVNFKEEVKGRITKKTKIEFLYKNKGKVLSKIKNKKTMKATPCQLNNQKD